MKQCLVIQHLFFLCFCDCASSQYGIRCKLPTIPHGIINDAKEEYKENEQLKYSCEKKYRPRHGTPMCLRVGWSITPECEEINCLLGPLTPGTSTSPQGKNVFRAGESVEITCSERRCLYGTREIKRNIICKESGEWEYSPVCEEITCDIPYDQHVDYVHYYFSRDRRLGVEKTYQCESGYHAGARTATCTENGLQNHCVLQKYFNVTNPH
ncbi:coagulation factor XIII B chain-like [Colossoma macropomum]|uniref:coagulation factor XIII B chain-like n=1 Tax=Colossoma macropomum TaxID=42526 RepID=UPI001863E39D|nr:coagulation factor XIII B chain-like [Colossoma macropomum]